jgi:hypothetical protein
MYSRKNFVLYKCYIYVVPCICFFRVIGKYVAFFHVISKMLPITRSEQHFA